MPCFNLNTAQCSQMSVVTYESMSVAAWRVREDAVLFELIKHITFALNIIKSFIICFLLSLSHTIATKSLPPFIILSECLSFLKHKFSLSIDLRMFSWKTLTNYVISGNFEVFVEEFSWLDSRLINFHRHKSMEDWISTHCTKFNDKLNGKLFLSNYN